MNSYVMFTVCLILFKYTFQSSLENILYKNRPTQLEQHFR